MDDESLIKELTDRSIGKRTRYEDDWETIREDLERLPDYKGTTPAIFDIAIRNAKNYFEEILHNSRGIVLKREVWYSSKVGNQIFWKDYINIMKTNDYSIKRIDSIEKQSQNIINFLPCPGKQQTEEGMELFCRKGLVYGNVQSGKTAIIAGVISMYSSANCKFVIVLSGITNNLRMQTQKRLIHDLGIDIKASWRLLTGDTDRISKGEQTAEALDHAEIPCIGVYKKNPSALNRLIHYCSRTNKDFWKTRQVLIIDDECDQYSPNVSDFLNDDETGEQYTHSKINGLIVSLCKMFPRHCYIGFTATPFATILNEMPGEESLYPADFIYALEKPANYFGGDKIFGKYDEETEKSETLDIVEFLPLTDAQIFKTSIISEIPDSLENAILYFIAATACKYKRDMTGYSTMLVHLDLKTAVHSSIENGINIFISKVKKNTNSYLIKIKNIWENNSGKVGFQDIQRIFGYDKTLSDLYNKYTFPELLEKILYVIGKIELIVDNSTRPVEERVKYETNGSNVFIVIGGNTLSRGLTLEGLIVSYFARDSRTYDTLLQMGRWYGFRQGYEDISRIWLPEGKLSDFQFLSDIEQEIRDEIDQYDFNLTPSDIGIRIRTHPRLQITRKMAMQSAVPTLINCSGQRPQTLFFKRKDKLWLDHNLEAARIFLDSIGTNATFENNAWIIKNIPVIFILEYIRNTFFHERNRDLTLEVLTKYITKANKQKELLEWNIAILNSKGNEKFKLSKNLTVELIERSRIDEKNSSEDAYLKILQQPKDMLLDMNTWKDIDSNCPVKDKFKKRNDYFKAQQTHVPGLLILYPINKTSLPLKNSKDRYPLEAVQHLIGQVFVFPIVKDKELFEYMTIPI